jgi:hypothetical protein
LPAALSFGRQKNAAIPAIRTFVNHEVNEEMADFRQLCGKSTGFRCQGCLFHSHENSRLNHRL